MPERISSWIDDTITRPLSTAMPDSAMNPTAAEMEKSIPRRSSASSNCRDSSAGGALLAAVVDANVTRRGLDFPFDSSAAPAGVPHLPEGVPHHMAAPAAPVVPVVTVPVETVPVETVPEAVTDTAATGQAHLPDAAATAGPGEVAPLLPDTDMTVPVNLFSARP